MCGPSDEELFAVGMNGDEDLAQDITMKGHPYHYAQNTWNGIKVATKPGELPPCHGTNGPDGVNCARQVCDGTNGPKDGESGTPCEREEPAAAIAAYKDTPTAGRPYTTTGDLSPMKPANSPAMDVKPAATLVQLGDDEQKEEKKFTYESGAPEKVDTLQQKHATSHTTYYAQI